VHDIEVPYLSPASLRGGSLDSHHVTEETDLMPSGTHGGAASAVGYQYQTDWCLLELLSRTATPDASISLELHDDVAWDDAGSARELIQLKHHQLQNRQLGDLSPDLWRTINVWLDNGRPTDPAGPMLTLVTTSVAAPGSAARALGNGRERNHDQALDLLEQAAAVSVDQSTARARQLFSKLTRQERLVFISRIYVADGSTPIQGLDQRVRRALYWAIPRDQDELFLSLVWRWWSAVALDMLRRRRGPVSVSEARAQIDDIRDMFSAESLPTMVELADVDVDHVIGMNGNRTFVHQMRWVRVGAENLRRAIVDYYRAVTQTTNWLDRDLVGISELERFEANLKDEWIRAYEDMIEDLPEDADDETKAALGKELLRKLRDSTAVTVRSRYTDAFFARGKRHELADMREIGWHPDFQRRLEELLQPVS
jgi:hypothetical protein